MQLPIRKFKLLGLSLLTALVLAACTTPEPETPEFKVPDTTSPVLGTSLAVNRASFTVRIEAVTETMLNTVDGSVAVPLSPGAWVVHTDDAPLFTAGEEDRGKGIEGIAEDGTPGALGAALVTTFGEGKSGIFNTPVDADAPGPIGPVPPFAGTAYEFTLDAVPGENLSLATMFIQSNDAFYAPGEAGIALFDENGQPVSGDVSDQISLWDAGTEVNEPYGTGDNQAPRQAGPNTGEMENGVVTELTGDARPDTNGRAIRVTVTPTSVNFTATLEALSTATTLKTSDGSVAVPLSPGAWLVTDKDAPLFTMGETASAGIEAIAEDGNPAILGAALATEFNEGSHGIFNTPVGATAPGPIGPGENFSGTQYQFSFDAKPGDKLSFATMFIQSNDLFYAPDEIGIELFAANGQAVTGNVSSEVSLWDSGTEVNEAFGTGANQAPRQNGPNTGEAEDGVVTLVR